MSANTIAAAFDKLQPDPKVLDFETNQPEFETPIWDYMAGLVDDERVADGKAAMAREAGALAKAETRFGVDRHVLAAIWGVELNFGENTGGRPLVQSLTTLACQSDVRPAYYRGELMATLKIADRGDIPLDKLTGSWAGAFGQTQFMPSTFLRLAVDLDGRGATSSICPPPRLALRPIIWRNRAGGPASRGASRSNCPKTTPALPDARPRRRCRPGLRAGSSGLDGQPLGDGDAGLLLPAGPQGPAFLVTKNFDVIYSYNAAESYTLAIAVLAQRLAGGPGVVTPWPTDDPGLSRAERRELQALLAKHGYDAGAPDGAIGGKTKTAIADFQGKNGMTVDGRASVKVLEALRR